MDGLDEYEGEHEELVQVIKIFAMNPNVKLCIASRPWNVFEAAFGDDPIRKLYLQDLNRPDIALYVKNKLEDRPDFQKLRWQNPEADELIKKLVDKSQGVFLWVFLVVRSLIHGLQNADRIIDLRRRLCAFPSDLNKFFNHILLSIDPIYRSQTAKGFQAALSARDLLSVPNFWFLDLEEEHPDFVIEMQTPDPDIEDLRAKMEKFRVEDMTKRINGRFNGLLEVTVSKDVDFPMGHKVDFLHRTVKDFLLTKDMQVLLSD